MGYILIEYFDMHSHQIIRIWGALIPNSTSHLLDLLWNKPQLSGMADLNMNLKTWKCKSMLRENCYWSSNTCVKRSTLLRNRTLKSIRYIAMGAISKYLYCFWQVCKYNRFIILVVEICTHINEAILWLGNVSVFRTIHRSKWKYPN